MNDDPWASLHPRLLNSAVEEPEKPVAAIPVPVAQRQVSPPAGNAVKS